MLLLPLHRPLTRATFPTITALLVLINAFVFVFLQSGDPEARQRAQSWYEQSGLADIEAPLFERYVEQQPTDSALKNQLDELPEEIQPLMARELMQRDHGFRQWLDRDDRFDSPAAHTRWHSADSEYQRLQNKVVTDRFALDAEQPRPLQFASSMFLHGGYDHLIGNMLFLIALGLLVEGPLGAGLFAALYLAAGVGAALSWLVWHDSGPGSVIGASGAIAGLMGAFCVLWGMRRVRFFYWFFVVFDYVRAPALVLLPLWLGWEVLQMTWLGGSQVAYSAHAGGIVSGALLALLVKQVGWHKESWFKENDDDAPNVDGLYRQALQALGQMQLAQAQTLFDQAVALAPQRIDVQLAALRCAHYAKHPTAIEQRALGLLALSAAKPAETIELIGILQELDNALWCRLPAPALIGLSHRLVAIGETEAAFAVLHRLERRSGSDADHPQHWLQLAFRLRDHGHSQAMRSALAHLATTYPRAAQAEKARFLISEGETGG